MKLDSFDSFSESLFMSNTSGNVLAKTCFRGFCTSVINQVSGWASKEGFTWKEWKTAAAAHDDNQKYHTTRHGSQRRTSREQTDTDP